MKPPKLKPVHIGIIAAVLALIAGGVMAKFWIMPVMQDNKVVQADVDNLMQTGSPANQTAADNEKNAALKKVAATKRDWAGYENRYFRIGPSNQPLDLALGGNRLPAAWLYSRERAETLGPKLNAWLASSGNAASFISVPAASVNPNDIPKDVIAIDFQGVKLTGTFQSVMHFLKTTRSAPRLVSVMAVSLSSPGSSDSSGGGVTPVSTRSFRINTVTADMDLRVYIFPRNGNQAGNYKVPAGAETGGGLGGASSGPPTTPSGPGMIPGGPPRPGMPPSPGRVPA
jgi:hypothetical protein